MCKEFHIFELKPWNEEINGRSLQFLKKKFMKFEEESVKN